MPIFRTPRWLPTSGFCLLAGLAGLAALAGCGEKSSGFDLGDAVEKERYQVATAIGEGLTFRRPPERLDLEYDHERRPVVLTAPGRWTWRGRVPERGRLTAGVQALPASWQGIGSFEAVVTLRDGRRREILDVTRIERGGEMRWHSLQADLASYSGKEVTLEFSAELAGLPAGYRDANLVAWSPVVVSAPARRATRPNVLFILVDTLRRDHLTPYGYTRDTSPEIARWLAGPGAVVEDAYSQAPWTLPSVVSFLTGRYPGELLGDDLGGYRIPDAVDPLAVRMQKLGYRTGGFIANPTLHAGAGFGRGFDTFFAPPADIEWIRRHADELNAHALPWLTAHQSPGSKPFFLYVHYIDPHDPYENPEIVDGKSPFLPGYTGPVTGQWVHGVYVGRQVLPDPERDLEQIVALYDSEVHYVDRHIGALLASLSPETLANTLIVLTADHGEELFDHGGWKHGQTLYEEQIHVPLLLRWDGHIPAGKRLAGTVRLLDLMPTLVGVAGGAGEPAWSGVDLLPALTGKARLPERPAFAQHLAGGPLRAAAILGREKLILFNREAPFAPSDEQQRHLWEVDHARMQRVELYDLNRDARERHNLAPEKPERVARLEPVLHRQLAREIPGLRLLAEQIPIGKRLQATMRFARPPLGWIPYFLGPDDRVTLDHATLHLDLTGDEIDKGLSVEGDFGRIEEIAAQLDGQPLPAAGVLTGGGNPYPGGALERVRLVTRSWADAAGPKLRLWVADTGARTGPADAETLRRLRALGYIR
jgi:arylsulfatase A-like enzyme